LHFVSLYNWSMKNKTIAVGLSGGVDSTLTALILKQRGYQVIGITLKLHDGIVKNLSNQHCGGNRSILNAQRSADELGIALHVIDCCQDFGSRILKNCWSAFESGSTPNPCFLCNAAMKFPELLHTARSLGAEQIATGHYARIEYDSRSWPVLKRGADVNKDQSYFLAGLSFEILRSVVFPLGTMQKEEVKKIAADYGLSSAKLAESQDLCFAAQEGHFSDMLQARFSGKSTPGIFIDEFGKQLGTHSGIHHYTIGQRRGLGFATGERVKIISIDPKSGVIVVSGRKGAAYAAQCTVNTFKWSREPLEEGEHAMAQVRYRQTAVEAVIQNTNKDSLQINFTLPVFGVTPGQILVLYRDDCVLGSGVISR